jgi:alkylhydroperoxidase family enzyme
MPRLRELRETRPGWLARIVYAVTRRKLGKVPESVKVLHRNPAILTAVGAYETALERASAAPARLKSLAELRVALMVGCPF